MIFWQHILDRISDNQKVYVLTVIDNHGSSPGRKGFKMLVAADGFIFGSIGGGVMEFALVAKARALIHDENPPTFIKKQIHQKNTKDGSGMICSGEQTVAFHCLESTDSLMMEGIISRLQKGERGKLKLTPDSFSFSNELSEKPFGFEIYSEEDWIFEEQLGFKETLYIVGGGHVGAAVSALFVCLGFYVVVFDNRENLNTLETNTAAHLKLVVNYNDIANHIPQGDTSYVAIMTNKYFDDKLVVTKLIRNHYKFIGVLGSTAKIQTMQEALLKEGFTQPEIEIIQAPIGLTIKSETPEEIAVSIAAQVIQVKNVGRN